MEYIDFGPRQKISRKEVQTFIDVYSSLKSDIPKNTVEYLQWNDQLDRIYEKFRDIPHAHYCSWLGPYCVACHCALPGPKGEWE